VKTLVCLVVIVASNALGNVLLSHGMGQVGEIASYSPVELFTSGVQAMANPSVLAGVVLLIVFFVTHAIVLSWADLSYVLLTTAIGYVVVALLGWLALGEHVAPTRWAGIGLIACGVALAGSTPASSRQ